MEAEFSQSAFQHKQNYQKCTFSELIQLKLNEFHPQIMSNLIKERMDSNFMKTDLSQLTIFY